MTSENATCRFKVLKSEDSNRCATFELNDEDHTLGNALRHMILKNPEVKFCGYALPHPNERKINIQIQVYSGEALDALEKGLRDLLELNKIVKEKIVAESERHGPVELVDSEGEASIQEDHDDEDDDLDDLDEGEQETAVAETSAAAAAAASRPDSGNVEMEEQW